MVRIVIEDEYLRTVGPLLVLFSDVQGGFGAEVEEEVEDAEVGEEAEAGGAQLPVGRQGCGGVGQDGVGVVGEVVVDEEDAAHGGVERGYLLGQGCAGGREEKRSQAVDVELIIGCAPIGRGQRLRVYRLPAAVVAHAHVGPAGAGYAVGRMHGHGERETSAGVGHVVAVGLFAAFVVGCLHGYGRAAACRAYLCVVGGRW